MKTARLNMIVVLFAGIVVGALGMTQLEWLPGAGGKLPRAAAALSAPRASYDSNTIKDLNNAFIAIAEKANPSVVTIFTDKVVKAGRRGPGASPYFSDPFREFFGDDFFNRFFAPRTPQGEQHLRGMGSGVIVSGDGIVLTNNHVVRDADKIQVMLLGGRRVDAKLIGTDAKTDIAVVKIKADKLVPISLGNSDDLRVGEWVLAIGSPLSEHLAHTVTAGIVSAKARSNVGLADYEDFIQTDAAINPGNSGGALLNLEGKLVGINTAIATQSGGFQGIGFAVPINMARAVMDALIEHGTVVRGWLGLYIQDVDETMAQAMKLRVRGGALISDVVEKGPAAKAGLRAGDVIVELDGKQIQNSTQLRMDVARRSPGSKVKLKVLRDGKEKKLTVVLGELPEKAPAPEVKKSVLDKLGMTVQTLDDQLAARLGLDASDEGVVVTQIDRSSQAFVAGLRTGDLIKEINRRAVTSIKEFNDIVSGLRSGDTVLFYVKRKSNRFFVAFELR